MYTAVIQFHRRFRVLPETPHPALLSNDRQLQRLARMLEELHEFESAHLNGDLVKAADALADLVYFALGTAALMSLPFDHIFEEVHIANMSKIRIEDAGDSKYKDVNDIVKPEGWQSPHESILLWLHRAGYVPPK